MLQKKPKIAKQIKIKSKTFQKPNLSRVKSKSRMGNLKHIAKIGNLPRCTTKAGMGGRPPLTFFENQKTFPDF